jgi:biotin-dependent carboxylase-like uncharacterized protein
MTPTPTRLTVRKPGPSTLVVDRGRPHSRSLGVPVGGAADRTALALGNALVGNPLDAAALEISLAGPTLFAHGEVACVLYGAQFTLGSDRQALTAGTTFTLEAGEELQIGGTRAGMRAYLCVRGGFQTPVILGSRSALQPIQAGDDLPCFTGRIAPRFIHLPSIESAGPHLLRVIAGPQASWFRSAEFYEQTFTVRPASNRMGLRLEGRPLTLPDRELVSEPVAPGAVQVTADGQCIVLGVDGQTIGGYPKIAHVIAADLDALGQLRPDARVHFQLLELADAVRLQREKQQELHQWQTRLRETLDFCGLSATNKD